MLLPHCSPCGSISCRVRQLLPDNCRSRGAQSLEKYLLCVNHILDILADLYSHWKRCGKTVGHPCTGFARCSCRGNNALRKLKLPIIFGFYQPNCICSRRIHSTSFPRILSDHISHIRMESAFAIVLLESNVFYQKFNREKNWDFSDQRLRGLCPSKHRRPWNKWPPRWNHYEDCGISGLSIWIK